MDTGRLHPAVRLKTSNVKKNLVVFAAVLFMFGFDGFKVALFACQNFCANAPAIGAGYFFVDRVVFLEASHTLHLGRYKTEVQPRMFRRCAFAQFVPMGLKGGWVKFGDFSEGDVNYCDTF